MIDKEFTADGDYDPKYDEELRAALERALNKWKHAGTDPDLVPSTTITKYLLIVRADGWDVNGVPVTQIMHVPMGTDEDMLGLIAGADTKFKAEMIAAIIERATGG